MSSTFDFRKTEVYVYFSINAVDGELADELESYLWANLIRGKRDGDTLYAGLRNREWSVDVIRYSTKAINVNAEYMQNLHDDVYSQFNAWVESMGGIDEVST